MKRRALITGVSGQDGSYLAELLLSKDYEVFGTIRRQSVQENELGNSCHLQGEMEFEYADVTDSESIRRVMNMTMPHEVYNLAGQSQVRISFEMPKYTAEVNGIGALNVLEQCRSVKNCRFYQASTSEMFGAQTDPDGTQSETTPMIPLSPYGASKLYAHNMVGLYRDSYGMFAASGILFNHESPRRGDAFVTQKIVKSAVDIHRNRVYRPEAEPGVLEMGALTPIRDWGHAKDYVRAMWLMLQRDKPEDFVIATGIGRPIGDMVNYVFTSLGMNYQDHIKSNPKFFRPNEVNRLVGNPTKAHEVLCWGPAFTFEYMMDEMITEYKMAPGGAWVAS